MLTTKYFCAVFKMVGIFGIGETSTAKFAIGCMPLYGGGSILGGVAGLFYILLCCNTVIVQ